MQGYADGAPGPALAVKGLWQGLGNDGDPSQDFMDAVGRESEWCLSFARESRSRAGGGGDTAKLRTAFNSGLSKACSISVGRLAKFRQ